MPDQPDDPETHKEAPPSAETGDDDTIRRLLQRSLAEEDGADVDVRLLVQKRLRERSQGKFYGEGWSTSIEPPVARYLVTSLIMLVIAVAVYVVLTVGS